MAKDFLVYGAQEFLSRLISIAVDEISRVWGVKGEVKKLEKVLRKIQSVLEDAERKQVGDVAVRHWLSDLKEAAFEADDVLDEIAYEALRQKLEIRNRFKNKVRNFFTLSNPLAFRIKIAHRIARINQKLNEIEKDKEKFNFRVNSMLTPASSESSVHRETASYVYDSEIVGRDGDKANIIDMLLRKGTEDVHSVIAIVGLGGLGKTTLAQLVYNDTKVQNAFNVRMWVWVSNNFNVQRVMKQMIESVSKSKFEASSLDVIQCKLGESLNKKNILLVLDDMWNEAQFSENWDKLYTFLRCASQGSKILVTTRDGKVAEIVGAREQYDLQSLPSDDCWSIFARCAFSAGGPKRSPTLEAYGREIAEKCAGVPLALRTLGGLMHSKKDESEWLAIKTSAIRNMPGSGNANIMDVLKLSYDNLSPAVKRCFLYCSLFPKDVKVTKTGLIQLWMAEGFLGSSRGNKMMEDIGNDYFDNLCWNSFFQNLLKNRFGEVKACKMHDLVHELALSIRGAEFSTVKANKNLKDASKVHYAIHRLDKTGIPKALFEATKLRTFCLHGTPLIEDKKVFNEVFLNFKSLRVLFLALPKIKELPSSIGELKHLRLIDVSRTNIKELPKSIPSLYNLQTLRLYDCQNLEKLPRELGNLVNLRHFGINLSGKWSEMPKEMRRLSCLQTLPVFKVGRKDDGRSITELEHLNLVRGKLKIYGLENVRDAACAEMANLRGKSSLYSVGLQWDRIGGDDDDDASINDDLVLKALEPHSNLKKLRIKGFGGTEFPTWIMSSSTLGSLVEMYLTNCDKCKYLPSFGHLPSLQTLDIEEMRNLEHLGVNITKADEAVVDEKEEVRTTTTAAIFPSLKKLFLRRMPNLREWLEPMSSTSFTCLELLHIEDCPELRVTPSSFPALATLTFAKKSSDTAIALITKNLSSLTSLFIEGSSDLKIIPYELLHQNKFLHDLYIKSCPQFEGFLSINKGNSAGSNSSSSINKEKKKELTAVIPIESFIQSAYPTISATTDGAIIISETEREDFKSSILEDDGLTNLESLWISDCPKLCEFPNALPSLKSLAVSHSNITFVGCLTSKLTSLTYLWMENILDMSFIPTHLLQSNNFLQELAIVNCRQLQDLPPNYDQLEALGSQQYLQNLKEFVVGGCQSLTSIDLLQGLPSLRLLEILDCRGVKCFPKPFPPLPHLEVMGIGPLSKELDYLPFPEITQHHFVSLHKLGIFGLPEIKSLPHQLQHLKALKYLTVKHFDSLISLPEWLANIKSLEALHIGDCKNLTRLPSKEAMKSLALLKWFEIKNCPLLKERCNEEKGGEEWIKISQIQIIKIDGDFVQDLT